MVSLLQTFDDLELVKDKSADVQAVRQVLDGGYMSSRPEIPRQNY